MGPAGITKMAPSLLKCLTGLNPPSSQGGSGQINLPEALQQQIYPWLIYFLLEDKCWSHRCNLTIVPAMLVCLNVK